MNQLFTAWTETAYHRTVHSETGEEPLARWATATPQEQAVPDQARLHEAFLWSERRVVTKTATVSLHGNTYQVDPSLIRRTVELVFDPFDLTRIEVRLTARPPAPRPRSPSAAPARQDPYRRRPAPRRTRADRHRLPAHPL